MLNRTNLGAAHGVIMGQTGQALGFTQELFARLPAAGILFEF